MAVDADAKAREEAARIRVTKVLELVTSVPWYDWVPVFYAPAKALRTAQAGPLKTQLDGLDASWDAATQAGDVEAQQGIADQMEALATSAENDPTLVKTTADGTMEAAPPDPSTSAGRVYDEGAAQAKTGAALVLNSGATKTAAVAVVVLIAAYLLLRKVGP